MPNSFPNLEILIEQIDLPEGWVLGKEFNKNSVDITQDLEAALEKNSVSGHYVNENIRWPIVTAQRVWVELFNPKLFISAYLRLGYVQTGYTTKVQVFGVMFVDLQINGRVTNSNFRDLPIASIEAALSSKIQSYISVIKLGTDVVTFSDGSTVGYEALQSPIGRTKNSQDFYLDVAKTYVYLLAKGVSRPVEELATINNVSLGTASNWLTKTRQKGYVKPYVRSAK